MDSAKWENRTARSDMKAFKKGFSIQIVLKLEGLLRGPFLCRKNKTDSVQVWGNEPEDKAWLKIRRRRGANESEKNLRVAGLMGEDADLALERSFRSTETSSSRVKGCKRE